MEFTGVRVAIGSRRLRHDPVWAKTKKKLLPGDESAERTFDGNKRSEPLGATFGLKADQALRRR